jgi:hypothetical protein
MVNGSLKFLLKLSTTIPKSTPKGHINKTYKNMSHQESREPGEVPYITKKPTQTTKLQSKIEQARNGQNCTRQGVADSSLQYLRQFTTVPPDSPLQCPRLSVVQKLETKLRWNGSVLGLKTSPDCPLQYFGLSASMDTEQQ